MKAKDLGIPFDGNSGKFNSITDVEGVLVGHTTIIKGEGEHEVGKGPIRTGVTAIFPSDEKTDEVLAGIYSYNGNGEMTGSHLIEETGRLRGPICITNTHSVGIVRDAIIEWSVKNKLIKRQFSWSLPVVAETYDGTLNDINGFHVKKEHVFEALESTPPTVYLLSFTTKLITPLPMYLYLYILSPPFCLNLLIKLSFNYISYSFPCFSIGFSKPRMSFNCDKPRCLT